MNRFKLALSMLLFFLMIYGGNVFGYTHIVSYGDSLTDNGNIGRFTDGALWVENLAGYMGAALHDHAYAGATTGYNNPPAGLNFTGLQWQVDVFGPASGPLPGSLFTLWAGANDIAAFVSPMDAASNVVLAMEKLYSFGARDFLVLNLPDIGKTPRYYSDPLSGMISGWCMMYNAMLDSSLDAFKNNSAHLGQVNLYSLDVFSMMGAYTPGTPDWAALFWLDGYHPSSVGHGLVSSAAINALNPVPIPSAISLFSLGLLALTGITRNRDTD